MVLYSFAPALSRRLPCITPPTPHIHPEAGDRMRLYADADIVTGDQGAGVEALRRELTPLRCGL
jgi:hypothetical protein